MFEVVSAAGGRPASPGVRHGRLIVGSFDALDETGGADACAFPEDGVEHRKSQSRAARARREHGLERLDGRQPKGEHADGCLLTEAGSGFRERDR